MYVYAHVLRGLASLGVQVCWLIHEIAHVASHARVHNVVRMCAKQRS